MAKLQPHRPKHDVPAPPIVWELELTTGQVAGLLGVGYRTVNRWCRQHGLPHRRLRRAVRRNRYIVLADLRVWLRDYLMGRAQVIDRLTPTARRRIAAFVGGN